MSVIKKYTKHWIKKGLLDHFDSGASLRGDVIAKTWLHSAIFYKVNGRHKTYGSLVKAREALAVFLEKEERFDDAELVRAYNLPINKEMPEIKKEERRIELINTLYDKIERGEDLGHRAQRSTDRAFVTACSSYFGSYGNIFLHENLDYSDFANRGLNKHPDEYFVDLLDLVESSKTFIRSELEALDYNLLGRVNKYESGYFNFLEKARLYYAGKFDFDMVRSIDSFLSSDEKTVRDLQTKENIKKRKVAIKSILCFNKESSYDVSHIFPNVEDAITGKDLFQLLDYSKDWFTSVPFSKEMYMERSNIKNVFHAYPEKIIKIIFGKQQRYFFHASIIKEEVSKGNVFDRVVSAELDYISSSPSQRKYFSSLVMPKLSKRLSEKEKYTPEEIKHWFYEFGGVRFLESYTFKISEGMSKKERDRVISDMYSLWSKYKRNEIDSVYQSLSLLGDA